VFGWAKAIFDRTPPRLEVARYRSARPLRNPVIQWELAEDGSALLVAEVASLPAKPFLRWLQRRAPVPRERKFELEPVGAFVWSLCDGKTTVGAMAKRLQDRYTMNRVEAEASLAAFLQMLAQRGLITMIVKKP
jgi:hypothetical protein